MSTKTQKLSPTHRRTVIILLFVQLLCGSLLLPTGAAIAAAPGANLQVEVAVPQRLIIDAIGIDTLVESVGKGTNGEVGLPSTKDTVAWYNPGIAPGAQGNAVIAGHLDDKVGPAIFWKLRNLKVGDIVTVVDANGVERNFAVTEVASYKWNEAPLARIFGFDLERDLNLITCAGQFSRRDANYSKRLVVYTRLVP